MDLKFISADCGHAITFQSLGGKCMNCGKLCCKECLIALNNEMLCAGCFIERLKA